MISRPLLPLALSALLLTVVPAASLAGQGATDIFLVSITYDTVSLEVNVDDVTRATDRDGYDNQPFFLPDGSGFFYTSIDAAGQADIFRYDVGSGRSSAVTQTSPESEYSATPIPESERFSVIRVEADSTQRLWSFAMDGSDPQVLIENLAPVGYQAWLDSDRVGLFVLGSPATFVAATPSRGTWGTIAEDIGRSLQPIPGTTSVHFLHRDPENGPWFKEYRWEHGAVLPLVQPLDGNEYAAWLPDGTMISGTGSELYLWRRGDATWTPFADLSEHGVTGISRIVVDAEGTHIAVVGTRDTP